MPGAPVSRRAAIRISAVGRTLTTTAWARAAFDDHSRGKIVRPQGGVARHVLILGERHLRRLQREPMPHQVGHASGITSPIERRYVPGGLKSEYGRAAW
jgi:hypothetical protein